MNGESAFRLGVPWLGSLLALPCLWAATRAGRRRRLIDNIPTSKTTGVFIGLVELKGTAEAEQPLHSFLAGQACVHYRWEVEEHWSRTVTETYRDREGKTQTRTRHESGWKTVAQGGETIPFYLQDECGVVRVVPDGAKLEPVGVFERTCSRFEPLYYSKGPPQAISDSDHRRRFTEAAIPLHTPLYVMGKARERQDVVAAEIAHDPKAPVFLISTRTEKQISSRLRWAGWGWSVLGLILCIAGFVISDLAGGSEPRTQLWKYAAVAAGYGAVSLGGWVWMVFNSLIDLRQRVRRAWSHVDVQLKRRHDLIPNLLQVVLDLRHHEAELQSELANLRAQLVATAPGEAGPEYQGLARTMIAVQERYPELKAQEAFTNLQRNLVDTEQRIALARGYFNEIATPYNTRLEIVPDRFIAALARMKSCRLLEAVDFERAPVAVNLAA